MDSAIETYTGKMLDIFAPDLEMIDIIDIARGLSMKCRWGGQVRKWWSVASHSMMCERALEGAPPRLRLTALLHDATEAYMEDMPSPIKRRLPDYIAAELNLQKAIADKFGLIYPFPEDIKRVDNMVLNYEYDCLKADRPGPTDIRFQLPELVERQFLDMYKFLMRQLDIEKFLMTEL